jgi:hypothetical protein
MMEATDFGNPHDPVGSFAKTSFHPIDDGQPGASGPSGPRRKVSGAQGAMSPLSACHGLPTLDVAGSNPVDRSTRSARRCGLDVP